MTTIIRGESIEDYHSHKAASSSKLKDFDQRGPRFYAARHVTSKWRQLEQTDSLRFGQLFEDIWQRPGEWEREWAVKPSTVDFRLKAGKAWREAHKTFADAGRIVEEEDVQCAREMIESIRENESAVAMIAASEQQVTLRTTPYRGLPGIQSRPDYVSEQGCLESGFAPFTLDLKSTRSLNVLTSGRDVLKLGYHKQAAICRELMRGYGETRHYLLAVEKCLPHRAQVIEMTPEWLDAGWRWCDAVIARLAEHFRTNEWPRVPVEMVALPPCPAWAMAEGEDEGEAA